MILNDLDEAVEKTDLYRECEVVMFADSTSEEEEEKLEESKEPEAVEVVELVRPESVQSI